MLNKLYKIRIGILKKIICSSLFLIPFVGFLKSKKESVFPVFNILLSDSMTIFNTDSIQKGKNLVLIYFSPDCEHCQKETKSILDNINLFKEVKFYFVTNDPFDRMLVFKEYYKIDHYKNITLGRDYNFFLFNHMKGIIPPYLALYNKDKKLREEFKGETKANELLSCIND